MKAHPLKLYGVFYVEGSKRVSELAYLREEACRVGIPSEKFFQSALPAYSKTQAKDSIGSPSSFFY